MTIKNYLFLWGVVIILMGGNPISAQDNVGEKDYTLKADFLYRFVDYVYWKDYSKNKTFKIAILGESPITVSLLNMTKNKKMEIKEYKNLNELGYCNILFVPHDSTIPIEKITNPYLKIIYS